MSKIKKIVEPKKFLKNQNIKKENKGEVKNYTQVGETEMQKDRDNAKDVSRIALWDNLINYYKQAYQGAFW